MVFLFGLGDWLVGWLGRGKNQTSVEVWVR
jgi:hypothetical protein